jgi:hypothetical protein
MRAARTAALMLALPLAALAATSAAARPAGFGCLWPINNLAENPAHSYYHYADEEHVFDLTVHLNAPSNGDGISVGPTKPGICKIVLPLGQDLRQKIYWREVRGDGGREVFRSLDIREAGEGGTFVDWLVLRPRNTTVTGVTTIEFHVYSGHSENGAD